MKRSAFRLLKVKVMVFSVKHKFTIYWCFYFILSLAATCFGHLFGHLQAILESVYFLFTLMYLQYTYIYTTTVIRDLLLCFVGKLLVMVALQAIGAGCCLLFNFIRHYECADPLVFRLSVLLYILPLMRGVRCTWKHVAATDKMK
jgi:hypothetical protein